MHNVDDSRLGLARAKFLPVAQVLDGIAKDIAKEPWRFCCAQAKRHDAQTGRECLHGAVLSSATR